MSVGTLQAAGMGAPLPSVMPFRILNKGPEYFRRQAENGARKPSAVERLEADKAKYVKSKQVASTKQEPVRPALSRQPLFSPGVRRVLLTPSRRCSPAAHRGENRAPKSSLNLEILNNLINICDSPLTSPRADKVPWQEPEKTQNLSTPVSHRTPNTMAVRRVDVRPGDVVVVLPPIQCPDILVASLVDSPAKPCPPGEGPLCSPAGTPNDPGKRQTLLHRSKSDLSDRYSRASADLERFFNYCGLDPGEVSTIGAEHFVRASSDIVSLKFHSVSAESSEYAQSQVSAATPEEAPAAARIPYGISIIERNARVIKWLYGLRQSREAQKSST
ncbi:protein FAM110A [Mantella aurantiaca]